MRVQIQKGAARQRWSKICQEANDAMPTFTVSRTLADGTVQQFERQKKRISDGAQQTGHALIMYFAQNYRSETIELSKIDLPADLKNQGEPSLRTNGELLARFRENITARTSRNHIKQLMDVGLITKKVFHGSKSRYELFFNYDIVFGKDAVIGTPPPVFEAPNMTNASIDFKAKNDTLPNTNGINFPHKQSLETNGNITTTISNVDNSTAWKQENGNSPLANPPQTSAEHGNRGEAAAKNPKIYSVWGVQHGKNVDKSAKNVDNYVDNSNSTHSATVQNTVGQDFERQHRIIQNNIISFWKYASENLYPGRVFTSYEYLMCADLILDSIYRPFLKTKPNEKEFNEFQRELLASIDVAAKYFNNNPSKYPGQPYTSSERYLGYFDVKNLRGFRVAVNWRFQNKAKQHEEYGKKVVNIAMLHLGRFATNTTHKLPKQLRNKTFREVYEHYKIKMSQYGPEIRELFVKRFNTLTF